MKTCGIIWKIPEPDHGFEKPRGCILLIENIHNRDMKAKFNFKFLICLKYISKYKIILKASPYNFTKVRACFININVPANTQNLYVCHSSPYLMIEIINLYLCIKQKPIYIFFRCFRNKLLLWLRNYRIFSMYKDIRL